MNQRIARCGHVAANRLIRLFRIQFEYEIPTSKSDDPSDNHLKGVRTQKYSNPIKINEPLVPVNSQSNNSLVNAQEGTASQYQYLWISKQKVPMKTKVIHDGKSFTVTNSASYQEIAGIFVYYLKGRSDIK